MGGTSGLKRDLKPAFLLPRFGKWLLGGTVFRAVLPTLQERTWNFSLQKKARPSQRILRLLDNPGDLDIDDQYSAQRELSRRSLAKFTKYAWQHVDSEKYVHNWHIDAICEHLEAVAAGDITRLLINVPPGTSKSSCTCVFFPAWLWGPRGFRHWKVLTGSYAEDVATRDNRRTRELVRSEWYQKLWPMSFVKQTEGYLENADRGFREAKAITGMTGKRGHVVVWDDPLNPKASDSPTMRNDANRILGETLSNRLISPEKSAIIVCMQRLHMYDVSGYILENELGYTHLCLPMEFETKFRCRTSIGFVDPRTVEGEPIDKNRFNERVIAKQKKEMTAYAYAGQNQQRPAPRGGGMFKTVKLKYLNRDEVEQGIRWIRGWDLAGTEDEDAAYTAGVKMGVDSLGRVVIDDSRRAQLEPQESDEFIASTAAEDGYEVQGSLPQDPGSAGKHVVVSLVTGVLAGYPYFYSTESGDKVQRATPLAAQVNAGNVYIVRGPWNRDFLDEAEVFPAGRFKDQIDAASRAYMELTQAAPSAEDLKGKRGVKNG